MKLPHVTIEYREDENYAIGKMSAWLIVGLALCLSWSLVTLLNGHTLIFPNIAEHRELFNNSAVFVYACAFFVYGFFHNQMRALFSTPKRRNVFRLVATFLMSASTVLMAIGNSTSFLAAPVVLVAGFLAGVGSTVLTMSFAISFSVCDVATASMSAGLSFSLAVIAYALVTKYCAGMVALCTAICFLCPFAEFLCLYQCSRQLVDRLSFADLTVPVKSRPFSLHIILPCLLVGFVISTVRVSMTNSFLVTQSSNEALLAVVSGVALSLAFIIGAILTQRQRFNFMARTLFPVSGLALACLAFIPKDPPLEIFLFTSAYILLDCALWVCLSDISQRFRVSAFVSFGFGYGALMMGGFVSLMLMGADGPLFFLSDDYMALTVISLAILMFGFAFLPNTTEVMDSLDIKGRCPAITTEAIELEILHEPSAPGVETPETERRPQTARDEREVGGERPESGEPVEAVEPDGPSEPAVPDQPVEEEAAPSAPSREEQPSELDELDRHDERKAMKARTKSAHPGRFKRKCAKVAETYLLSRKETEVLFLLAKGRNAAAIQEALYIAPGTANTHMRHIYRKLDVHSQQELIELVEATEVDDENNG